jgi:hypothetical protein
LGLRTIFYEVELGTDETLDQPTITLLAIDGEFNPSVNDRHFKVAKKLVIEHWQQHQTPVTFQRD